MTDTDEFTVYELTSRGNDLVDETFLQGRNLTDEEIESAREEIDFDLDPDDYDIEGLRQKLDAIRGDERVEFADGTVINGSEYERGDASIDAAVAGEVRKHLNLTREQAAHDGVWRYLAVVEFPKFVRYRWPYPDPKSNRSFDSAKAKYLKHSRDLYEQAFVRLWWIAELTRDGDDYNLTRVALSKQELANDVFDRGFARYPEAVRATVEELADANSNVVSRTTTKFNHALSTVRLESLTESELREMVCQIRESVESGTVA